MDCFPLSDCVPRLIYSMYWERKDKFLFYEDTYKEWTIFAVESGSFYYELGGDKGIATFGDLLICPPKTPFRRVIVKPLTFFVLRLRWYNREGTRIEPSESREFFTGKINIQNTSRLSADYMMMKKSETFDNERRLHRISHYVQDIWLMYCGESGEEQGADNRITPNQPDPKMLKASSLIQKHAFQTIDLKHIAAILGLSPARLTQKFKADFGITPIQHLTSIRLEKAKRLLLETTLTLEQISESIGYQNGYYLNRIFMKHMNVTPAKYRKAHSV
ncbi:helix-turn-helix transcriptional regulator [Paenibacillus hemerocallicola]|uniref:Helix-turn-helix transcriptional regulator n=1 Tax=Paenibacillus hemerocallicola TaxID=1172614 RepID=A0A5C4T6S7_9BACL|nr:AraC family transcriptional regulator [Paenibacillus hemerocallicola]TNJ63949.1 helix-turn-helix transcriptional regulator [Paenibacillus hemerocallicola]